MASNSRKSPVLQRQKLSEQVYELLERSIVNGEMLPGTPLAEEKIARQFGISRSPVRHAIAALQRRGLAEWAGKRDRRVSIPSAKFVADVLDTCTVLESGRICSSSRAATESDHTEIREALARMKTARRQDDAKEYRKQLIRLRELLVCRCDNEKLNRLSEEFETYRHWIMALSSQAKGDVFGSEQEHRKIAQLYIDRDLAGLMKAIESHAEHRRASILEAFERQRVRATQKKGASKHASAGLADGSRSRATEAQPA